MGNCGTKEPSSGTINSSQQGRYEERKPESEGVVSNDLKIHTSSMLHLNCYQNWIGTCSDDQSIALVNITSLCRDSNYRPITLKGHQKAVNKLVFVPPSQGDSLKLWSASRDLSIRLVRALRIWIAWKEFTFMIFSGISPIFHLMAHILCSKKSRTLIL